MARVNRFGSSLLGLALVPALALAHPGHDVTTHFAAGFLHPFTGLDHLLAMIAVGLWAGHLGQRAAWMLCAAFPLAMLAGAAFAIVGVGLPAIEPVIALSVVTLGTLIALRVRVHAYAGMALVGTFAMFHGYAHGSEAASGDIAPFASGFVIATIVLHLLGLVLAERMVKRDANTTRLAGSLIGAAGAAMLLIA